jgi:hypothetical protein
LLTYLFGSSVLAGTPSSGIVYIGAAFGVRNVYKVAYQYDGVGTMTATTSILATLPSAADAAIVPGGDIVVAGQGPSVYKVNSVNGSYTTVSSNNNGNTISPDPGGASVWIGWSDTSPSQVPLKPFAMEQPTRSAAMTTSSRSLRSRRATACSIRPAAPAPATSAAST